MAVLSTALVPGVAQPAAALPPERVHGTDAGDRSAGAVSPDVVISQVYGGGGNTGATFTNDFIELFNRSAAPVSLNGWSVQYSGPLSAFNVVTPLSGTIAPGGYYLIQEAQGAGGTTPLPTPDTIGTISMGALAGKVALVPSTTPLGCGSDAVPCSGSQLASMRDLVGYGSSNLYEGAGPAPGLSNTTAALRNGGGAVDTDSNNLDFIADAPNPRNSGAPPNQAPDCTNVSASPNRIWPPRRDQFRLITLSGATDTDGDTLSYHIDAVSQDEPVSGAGVGDDTFPDAQFTGAGADSNQVLVRSERNPWGNGRVYRIAYTVSDGQGGTCSRTAGVGGDTNAKTGVPRFFRGQPAVDDGDTNSWNSFTGAPLTGTLP
ncbi:lamin tail domain-containing protein [Streptomyces sp. NPDC055815]